MPADNSVKILPSPDVLGENVASDYVGGAHYQRIKDCWGPDGTVNEIDDVAGKRLPVVTYRNTSTVTISVGAGATLSASIDIRGYDPFAIAVPATFDGSQIRFQMSMDNAMFFLLYASAGVPVQMTVAPSETYPAWGELAGWSYMKIVTVTAQATTSTDFIVFLRSS